MKTQLPPREPDQAAAGSRPGSPSLPGLPPRAAGLRGQWERFAVSHRPYLALGIAAGLGLFLLALPPQLRRALWDGLAVQRAPIALALAFTALNLSLLWAAGQRFDAWVYLRINRRRRVSPWLDGVMLALTQVGNGLPPALLLAGLLWALGHPRLALELSVGISSLWVAVELLKALAARARPYLTLSGARLVGWQERGRSFPSGHTAQVFFLAALLVHYFQLSAWLSLFGYALAALVGLSRIYLGVHYPRDVLAGAVLGSLWGLATLLLDPFLRVYLP